MSYNDKNIINTMEAFVLTTPVETVPFLIVKPNTPAFDKFVMENYISFYAFDYQEEDSDGFWLRFGEYMHYGNIEGFSTVFIPMEISKDIVDKKSILIELLDKGYVLACDYNQYFIESLPAKTYWRHCMIIYGYNTKESVFYCKEFQHAKLYSFEAKMDEMVKALSNFPWEGSNKKGILGIKIDPNRTDFEISYYKLYKELEELCNENILIKNQGIKAFGIAAIDIFLNGIEHYPELKEKLYRCYYWINYIRVSCKLMQYRLDYIRQHQGMHLADETVQLFEDLRLLANVIFVKLAKYEIGGDYTQDTVQVQIERCHEIRDKYLRFAKALKSDVLDIVQEQRKKMKEVDIYETTRKFVKNVG